MSSIFPAENNLVFERNIEGCLVAGMASPAVIVSGAYLLDLLVLLQLQKRKGVYRLPIDVEDNCGAW